MAVVLHTTSGDLPVLLQCQTCPLSCFNFLALCASGYYDGCSFYRHFPGVLLQTGDPTNSGKGGESIYIHLPTPTAPVSSPSVGEKATDDDATATAASITAAGVEAGRYFRDEGFGETSHARRGVLSMAHRGTKADTNASQFFITTSPQPAFDRVYTAFGSVDLGGVYDAAAAAVVEEATGALLSPSEGADSAGCGMTGESVLRALEEAAADVDAKGLVIKAAGVRIKSVTVLYNPFAEGKMRPW